MMDLCWDKEKRRKKENEEKQIKEWFQKMETRVKKLEEELFSARTQDEEAKAKAITIRAKRNQAEKEKQALRNQYADKDAQIKRYNREIEKKQIQAYRRDLSNDEQLKQCCTKCQGWRFSWDVGFRCQCIGYK